MQSLVIQLMLVVQLHTVLLYEQQVVQTLQIEHLILLLIQQQQGETIPILILMVVQIIKFINLHHHQTLLYQQ